jgi:EAL domain-containing protein (putative c-di-GMP-specific phosphodiesterase class I)
VLDDFGTGYSSLSYLQNLDFDCLKIDKSFLKFLGKHSRSVAMMRAVIDLGHSLGLKVVAEGIENEWQARLLQLLNCDFLQGYFIGVPMTLEKLREFRDTRTSEAVFARMARETPDADQDPMRLVNGPPSRPASR